MTLWNRCVDRLEGELPPQQFNTWIRPLQAVEEDGHIRLLAPNQFVLDWVKNNYLKQISSYAAELSRDQAPRVLIEIGTRASDTLGQRNRPNPSAARTFLVSGGRASAGRGFSHSRISARLTPRGSR